MTRLAESSSRLGRSLTLGIMTDRISEPYQCALVAGVLEATKASGASVLCFVGAPIPADPHLNARHRSFELIGPNCVNAVVALVGTLMHDVGKHGVAEYCRRHLPDTPLCSVGASIDGWPSLTTSNREGVRELVGHLAREHHGKRFAFVRGPFANEEAESRYRGYLDALDKHGLEFDERLVAVGDFMQPSGREAVRQFAQVRGMLLSDLDAIVASNDSMAIGVLNGLEEQGIKVPGKVAVVGFDDAEEASLVSPSLTTVRQPLAKIGRQAARTLMDWIHTGTEPKSTEITTEVMVRRSCGCSREATGLGRTLLPELKYSFDAALLIRRQHILERLTRAGRGELGVAGPEWQTKILNAFVAEFSGEGVDTFAEMIEDIAIRLIAGGSTVQPCHDVVDCLRQQLGATLYAEPARRTRAEDIFYAAHLALSEVTQRGMLRARLQLGRWVREIGLACNAFSGISSHAELAERARKYLPQLGIEDYFIAGYRDGNPDRAELLAAHDRSGELIDLGGQFEARDLLPRSLLGCWEGGKSFAVMPLAHNTRLYGHALFELDLERALAFDELADALGTGLHIASQTYPSSTVLATHGSHGLESSRRSMSSNLQAES